MRKIYVFLFIFLIIFSLNHNVFAIDALELETPTTNSTSNTNLFLKMIASNPSTIVSTIMYFLFILICFYLFKTNKSKKLMIVYKILILVSTLGLCFAFIESMRGLNYYAIHVSLSLIEIFIGILPKNNKTRMILTLIPVVLCIIILIPVLLDSSPGIEGESGLYENMVFFSQLAIIPEIISQIALAPLYLYYRKDTK